MRSEPPKPTGPKWSSNHRTEQLPGNHLGAHQGRRAKVVCQQRRRRPLPQSPPGHADQGAPAILPRAGQDTCKDVGSMALKPNTQFTINADKGTSKLCLSCELAPAGN